MSNTNKQNADELIEIESLLDTLIETTRMPNKTYKMFRAAVNQFQKDLEAKGITGKWRTK
jgi:hypothetical protein